MSSSDPGAAAGDQPPRRKPFLQQSHGDMVRSLLLFVAVIALVYGCNTVLADERTPQVETVDYSAQLASAERLADYEVLAPQGLPEGWRATSVDVEETGDAVAWHLGFLSPDDRYVGVEQTSGELDPVIADRIGRPGGATVEVGGRSWKVYRGGRDNALVRVDDGVTTVVNGSPEVKVLRRFAASLR